MRRIPFVSRTHGQIWLLSTPTRQTGFFYNFWHDTESDWHRVFSNVNDCPDIDRDYLAMQQRANPIRYSQDFLCQFTQPANRLCSRETANAILRKKGDDKPQRRRHRSTTSAAPPCCQSPNSTTAST